MTKNSQKLIVSISKLFEFLNSMINIWKAVIDKILKLHDKKFNFMSFIG